MNPRPGSESGTERRGGFRRGQTTMATQVRRKRATAITMPPWVVAVYAAFELVTRKEPSTAASTLTVVGKPQLQKPDRAVTKPFAGEVVGGADPVGVDTMVPYPR